MEIVGDGVIDSGTAEQITETIAQMTSDPQKFWSGFLDWLIAATPKFLTAIVIFIVGAILVRIVLKGIGKLLTRSKLDPTLHPFLLSILRVSCYILLVITVLAVLVPNMIVSMLTLLGVFGLAISLAVKDSLSNLAGGISVLFTKPFALGDYVKISSTEGTVQEIRLNYTVLSTIDNKIIHIPNGDVAKAEITNYTQAETRRLDIDFSIGYDDDFETARDLILDILKRHPKTLDEPPALVRMMEHASSSIVIGCRVWVNTPDYWTVKYDLLEQVKKSFDTAGISIPYDQLDVIVHNQK